MAKDPAFLFYSQDFITGTMFMNNEQIGIYIRLLCAQHQHGGLIGKTAFNSIIATNDIIKTKFIETDEGFYNIRLMDEMVKRTKKSNNLSANALSGWVKRRDKNAIALQAHMPPEDEDVNENEDVNQLEILNGNKTKKFVKPTPEEITEYAKSKDFILDGEYFYDKYESNGWMVGKAKMKDWKAVVRTWKKNKFDTQSKTEKREAVPNEKGEFHELQAFVKSEAKKIAQLPLQLSYQEAVKLRDKYERDKILKVFRAMENRSDLLINNDSVYLTAKNWLERNKE